MTYPEDLREYLQSTEYIDSDDPDVVAKARDLTADCRTDVEKVERIYYYTRELPYDLLQAFRYLAQGKRRASDVVRAGNAFCMGKATVFAALCRAIGVPSRIGFQQISSPGKPFLPEEMRLLWGERKFPWHSLGEAYLNGRWLKLDATIHSAAANTKGMPYVQEFDGQHDILTVEGPVIAELESHADYPRDVAEWYEGMAREFVEALDSAAVRSGMAADEAMFSGPKPETATRA